MEALSNFFSYLGNNWVSLFEKSYEHIIMVALGIGLALVVGIHLGILCTRSKLLETVILSLANVVQVIPSLALPAIMSLSFGPGVSTDLIQLSMYSQLPITRNTFVGLKEVDKNYVEAGTAMGMTPFQILLKVKFPLSLSFILAGLRIAVVIAIRVATLAPYFGGEGLGR